MSAYYDLFEKPDVRQIGEQQSLYARFVPKNTIDRKEFIERVHLFTGLSRSLLEGAMAGFMDVLRDCLVNGWTVELGELDYFILSLSCTRKAMDKKELRAASIALRGLNFRLGRKFYKDLKGKMQLEHCPQSASASASSADAVLGVEQRRKLQDEYLQQYPCINRIQYARLAGCSYKQAVVDLNKFIEEGVLMRHGMVLSVVYAGKSDQDLAICNSETYLYTIIDYVMDKMTPEQRHQCMSSIRSKNTKPEMVVRRYLFSRGFRFRVNVKRLPGTPDIVLRKYQTVIFVNGCFWHGHEGCRYFVLPKSNVEFWKKKIERNRRRDLKKRLQLRSMGWHVMQVWECQLKPKELEMTLKSIEMTLNKIFLENYAVKKVKPYLEMESERMIAAENGVEYGK